ncbi:hypothetical protein BGZ96_004323 [Linnemannia gamsii]|uniref:Uncharacterized protein n=1 Tax=Linnemannia gamsii TaxID=64522 RepID=A0ABQ7JIB0_9FUNG|nr:hypothetical protein BGZ96_004323 [Linnemannia gamsii]
MTISAPIPVPGTQQEPTMPSLGSTTSTTIIHINSSGNSSDLHKNNSNGIGGGARITTTTIGTSTPIGVGLVGSSNHLNSNNSNGILSKDGKDNNNNNNNPGGLRRFPSIGNTKKLHLENSTLRSKITELERYLQGLKEELILAHRQIHAKNQEAKISQERKAVEIHELGQHIQRCEFDLLAKTAECEALQNKLQYQTKEQVSKLKHINMLETEIMDYRRMSIMSGYGPASASISGPATIIGPGGIVARGGSVLFRNSRNSSDLTESVRSSTVLQDSSVVAAAVEEATAALQAQIKQLKDEHWKKDEQILELSGKIQFLTDSVSQLEKDATSATSSTLNAAETVAAVDEKEEIEEEEKEEEKKEEEEKEEEDAKETAMTPATSTTDKNDIVSESTSNASFNTAATGGEEISGASHYSSFASIVNNVGYDLTVEHPKLISRYQALSTQHAQASEYLGQLETENQDLKVQLLDVSETVVAVGGEDSDVVTPTVDNPEPIAAIPETSSSSTDAIKEEEEEVKKVEEVKEVEEVEQVEEVEEIEEVEQVEKVEEVEEVEEATTPTFTTAVTSPVIAPSISRSSLHHPAASGLTPLDTVAVNAEASITAEIPSSASSDDSSEGSSPSSAVTSSSSPSTVVAAPALTRKSSLRYSRDGQVLPALNATNAAATTNAP